MCLDLFDDDWNEEEDGISETDLPLQILQRAADNQATFYRHVDGTLAFWVHQIESRQFPERGRLLSEAVATDVRLLAALLHELADRIEDTARAVEMVDGCPSGDLRISFPDARPEHG